MACRRIEPTPLSPTVGTALERHYQLLMVVRQAAASVGQLRSCGVTDPLLSSRTAGLQCSGNRSGAAASTERCPMICWAAESDVVKGSLHSTACAAAEPSLDLGHEGTGLGEPPGQPHARGFFAKVLRHHQSSHMQTRHFHHFRADTIPPGVRHLFRASANAHDRSVMFALHHAAEHFCRHHAESLPMNHRMRKSQPATCCLSYRDQQR